MYEIKTSDYKSSKKILVDGREWLMKAPGAGDELSMGQAKRRMEFLQKKVDAGTATEEDYNLYDSLENKMFSVFTRMFTDGSPDNSEVNAWLHETPMMVIYAIVEDIKRQAEAHYESTQIS